MNLLLSSSCRTLRRTHLAAALSRRASVFSTAALSSNEADAAPIAMTDSTKHLLREMTLDTTTSTSSPEQITMRKRMALARAITLVESKAAAHRQQADLLLTELLSSNNSNTQQSFRLGIAGPPGAGKSTWIEAFGMKLLNNATTNDNTPNKLAVVCIDPSSSVTGGSILGDKTRMMELSRHNKAYVRPSANGGTFGGLSAYTHDVVSLCLAADYDFCIVESVGLGQSEVEIAESVDMLILIVPPGGGDELQGVKKGIMEVADMLIVNKADGNLLPAARSTAAEYKSAVKFLRPPSQGWTTTPVILTSAFTGEGMDNVWNKINDFRQIMEESGELERKRQRQAKYWMWKNLQSLITQQTQKNASLGKTALEMERALDAGTVTPRVAAARLLDSLMHTTAS